jgi:hypothetical protein
VISARWAIGTKTQGQHVSVSGKGLLNAANCCYLTGR